MGDKPKNPELIRIAATGDSMTDTAGPEMNALAEELKKKYPKKKFELINQGVGGTRVGYGLWRLTNSYEFKDKPHPPLISLQPDIVLLESFAYNNGSDGPRQGGLEHFRKMHLEIIRMIQQNTKAKIVCVVTIAPNPEKFLESVPNFYNTPVEIRRWMADDRKKYLEEFELIAEQSGLPTANIYRATLEAQENGTPLDTFIDPKDNIHPSHQGHVLTAEIIVKTLSENNLI